MALFAAWFPLIMAEPAALHSCPLHGHMQSVVSAAHDHDAAGAHHAHHGAASETSTPSGHGAHCTCLGQCCAVSPVALHSARVMLGHVATTARSDSGLPDYHYVPVAAAHVLPFQNGPPATL